MKKHLSRVCVGLLVVSALAVPLAMSAQADSANSAIHIDSFGCGLFDGNGAAVVTTDSRVVNTSSGNGNLNCTAQVAPSTTGKAVHYDFDSTGALCGVPPAGTTEKWHETVSASGNATLSCHATA